MKLNSPISEFCSGQSVVDTIICAVDMRESSSTKAIRKVKKNEEENTKQQTTLTAFHF